MGFWDCSGISWAICKQSAPCFRQITTPTPHHSILLAGRSSWRPNNSVRALKDKSTKEKKSYITKFIPSTLYENSPTIFITVIMHSLASVLWCCWLGSRKGIRPVKNWVVGCWHGYLSGARCILAYGPADATATHCLLLQ